MREILFRGKRLYNGEWVFGMLGQYHDGIKATIMDNHFGVFENTVELVCVAPETVGQYTGLKDKNGKMIWEGDILSLRTGRPHVVRFKNGAFILEDSAIPISFAIKFEIIGNVTDNPELLKEEDET